MRPIKGELTAVLRFRGSRNADAKDVRALLYDFSEKTQHSLYTRALLSKFLDNLSEFKD
jgi:hypothetical protein